MIKDKNNVPGFRKNDSNQPYFEGFYFKFINEHKELVIIIAGISISKKEKYSFIQIASNQERTGSLHKFPITEFNSSKDDFSFSIGKNIFSKEAIILNLESIKVNLQLKNTLNWNRSFLNPNIMGVLSFVPNVECKHDIITIEAEVTGDVELQNQTIKFENGSGYIEKNWGYSFPKKYIWLHANQFTNTELSLQFAMAKPKWYFFRPQVYIGYLMNGRLIHFGSHRLSWVKVKFSNDHLLIKVNKISHKLIIKVTNKTPVHLKSPKEGRLENEILEYLDSDIELVVLKKRFLHKNKEIINDVSKLSTTEIHDEL